MVSLPASLHDCKWKKVQYGVVFSVLAALAIGYTAGSLVIVQRHSSLAFKPVGKLRGQAPGLAERHTLCQQFNQLAPFPSTSESDTHANAFGTPETVLLSYPLTCAIEHVHRVR